MIATVTLYGFIESAAVVSINNGFSFGLKKLNSDKNFFYRIGTSNKPLQKSLEIFDIIYISIFCTLELDSIINIMDERWIIGGPIVDIIKNFDIKIPCKTTIKTIDEYTDNITDYTFNTYFERLMKIYPKKRGEIIAGLGSKCYWGKCRFCSFSYGYKKRISKQNDLFYILTQLENLQKPYNVNFGTPAISPKQLESILKFKKQKNYYKMFLIPSKPIIEILEKFDNNELENTQSILGMESLSFHNRSVVNKISTDVEILEMVENIIRLNGIIELTQMTGFFSTQKEDVQKAHYMIKQLEKRIPPEKLATFLDNENQIIRWPLNARKWLESVTDYKIFEIVGKYTKSLHVQIPSNTDTYKYNMQIRDIVNNSKLCKVKKEKMNNPLDEEFNI